MSKKIKKLLIAILSIMAFVVIGAIGVIAATSAPDTVGIVETEVPVSLYTLDDNLVKSSIPLKNSLQTLSQTNIPFEVLDFTNKQTDSINGYGNYSFYATNDPTFIGRPFNVTFKWFSKEFTGSNNVKSNPKSRLSIAKLYKVTPGSTLSFLIAEEDVNNSGGVLADARILFAEYNENLYLQNDGAWISAQDKVKLGSNTHYVAIIIRFQDGSSAIGSGTETTVGWGTSGDNLNLGSFEKKDIIFKPFKYYLDINGNGSYTDTSDVVINRYSVEDISENANLKTNPTKVGYTFKNWKVGTTAKGNDISSNWKYSENVNKLKGIKIVKNNPVEAYYDQYFRDLYFTAVYEPNPYKVHYNANGGTGTMTPDNVKYDASYTPKSNTFTKVGYKFVGWYDNAACTGTKYSSTFTYKRTSDLTLYAKWEPINNTISFNANGGTGSMSALTVTYDKSYTLPANAFTRVGYTFLKWNTNSAGTGTVYTNKQSGTWKGTSNITLYAQWSANPYKVHYNANGGTGTMASDSVKYDASYTPKANAFTKTGYKFAGWYDNAACTGTKYSSAFKYKRTSDLTLYAKWEPISNTISFNANGGTGSMSALTVTYDKAYTLPANAFTRVGYTFSHWNTASNKNY